MSSSVPPSVRQSLHAATPIDRAAVLLMLRNHAIPGAERFDDATGSVTRLVTIAGADVAVTVTVHEDRIDTAVDARDSDSLPDVVELVRGWFDLDTDLALVARHLGTDPVLAPLLRARPYLRVTRFPDGPESAVMHVLGQQVSMGAARTFGGRLVAAYGAPGPAGLIRFPSPAVLAAAPLEELRAAVGITNARARTVRALATVLAAGLDLSAPSVSADGMGAADDAGAVDTAARSRFADVRRELLAVPGIGPWTADSIAARVLGDPDAFPSGDLVLRRALGVTTPAEAESRAESWRPWRAYALFHLWLGAIAP